MPAITPEVWTALGIVAALILGGMVGRVWKPMRKTISAIDVVAGRPERYPGDEEARPGLVERLDRLDAAIRGVKVDVVGIRSELDAVKQHVEKLEGGCSDE
jgi:hypothetical protein